MNNRAGRGASNNWNPAAPLLSVIIVNWNTHDLLARCLSSFSASTDATKRAGIEVFMVDNASKDGSVRMVRERFPWVTIIANDTNVGFARANNQAIRASRGEYILLLNSDTELLPDALESLVKFMEQHDGVGAAGALLLNTDGSLQESAQPIPTPSREFWRLSFLDRIVRKASYRMNSWDRMTPRQVDILKGACLLLRREAIDEVGLLDESYFMYSEEVDFCHRLALAGWEIWWVPGARVVHFGGGSSRQIAEEMYVQLYRSKVQYFRKFGGERRAKYFKYLLRLSYYPRAILATALTPALPAMSNRARLYRRLLVEIYGM